ncbi:hypothetical protein MO867_21255 [Microbulbifer sp. OS29]|uniref:Uncharacterized protein n=1 Tax=Microbulbifer okhotskensis TaxID=2926617 RepID=A0A9X2ER02_9GAMM|nr:hypothetical protein [Microbulbifer okhotskensis]MCO1336859.1 hypothetical protein [Microbulbifer okhotskensis]
MSDVIRQPVEITYQAELEALREDDSAKKPENWSLSPQSVVKYLMGGGTAGLSHINQLKS